jgi:FAD/FMN-containing dehydrogenase
VGHSVSDGGMVIDLSRMKKIWIDPVTRTAHVQAGLRLGEFVREAQRWGLATTTGTVSGTGLSGLTLGGGIGWLMGKYGLTIDNVRSIDLVTADGRVLVASETEHADLFWGLRGGGGNFGIATAFELQLHVVGPVLAGKVVYPISKAKEVLRWYREFTATAPDELTAYAALMSSANGVPVIAINMCYSGPLAQGEAIVAPVRKFGQPLADLLHPKLYAQTIATNIGAPEGRHYDEKAVSLYSLSDEVIDLLAEYGAMRTSAYSQVLIQHVHGAVQRVPSSATAFALRDIPYVVNLLAAWPAENSNEASRHRQWMNALYEELQPAAAAGVYSNFLGDEGDEGVRASYGANYERLAMLKQTYDPHNIFHLNHNIQPTV